MSQFMVALWGFFTTMTMGAPVIVSSVSYDLKQDGITIGLYSATITAREKTVFQKNAMGMNTGRVDTYEQEETVTQTVLFLPDGSGDRHTVVKWKVKQTTNWLPGGAAPAPPPATVEYSEQFEWYDVIVIISTPLDEVRAVASSFKRCALRGRREDSLYLGA